ncbi:hypothetical protein ABN154_18350 [Klebsiella michiganensis]|uniref:DUF6933 domain-containing protein n=1 Tax=Klebsiella michiganensis TaxID=1134687 RepID=UPI0032DB8436
MMIINCSALAASHLYGKYKKNSDEGFFEPSSMGNQTIMDRQLDVKNKDIIQWVVHAVKIGRSTCLIAMEYQTRWVHVIHQVPKGDVTNFIERLNSRLISGIEWLGDDFSLFSIKDMERSIDRYFRQHKEVRFYQQTDASVMAHISQVSAEYNYVYSNVGSFPDDEETALGFDLKMNDTLRSSKNSKSYAKPLESMLERWIISYVKMSPSRAAQLMERVKSLNSMAYGLQTTASIEKHFPDGSVTITPIESESEKIIDLMKFKNSKK